MRHLIPLAFVALAACSSGPDIHAAAGTSSGGEDAGTGCASADACPSKPCAAAVCTETGICSLSPLPQGTPCDGGTCSGLGQCDAPTCHATADCPMTPCATSTCFDGGCLTAYADDGTPCDGGTCAMGQCNPGGGPACTSQPCPPGAVTFCPNAPKAYCCADTLTGFAPACATDAGILSDDCPAGCATPCAIAGDGGVTCAQ